MPQMKFKESWKFSELSESAKERARAWYRDGNLHYDWWDNVYEDAIRMAEIIGISVDYRYRAPSGPGRRSYEEPKIWFSGFCHQGSGACWEGSYSYAPGALKKLQSEAPAFYKDAEGVEHPVPANAELHRIAKALQDAQKRQFYQLEAYVTHRGHYYHSGCMRVEVHHREDHYRDIGDAEEDITDALRHFADWIYRRLEEEYEWLNSDEVIDEHLEGNDYDFCEDGSLC